MRLLYSDITLLTRHKVSGTYLPIREHARDFYLPLNKHYTILLKNTTANVVVYMINVGNLYVGSCQLEGYETRSICSEDIPPGSSKKQLYFCTRARTEADMLAHRHIMVVEEHLRVAEAADATEATLWHRTDGPICKTCGCGEVPSVDPYPFVSPAPIVRDREALGLCPCDRCEYLDEQEETRPVAVLASIHHIGLRIKPEDVEDIDDELHDIHTTD